MTTAAIWSLLVLSMLLVWLTWIWRRHQKLPSRAAGIAQVQRLLKPRTPDDCPACRLAPAAPVDPRPRHPSVTKWREVKSRRGAMGRIDTAGFACRKPTCAVLPYHRRTDPCPGRRWSGGESGADPDLALPGVWDHLQCPPPLPSG